MKKALLIAEKSSVMQSIKNAYNKIRDSYPYDIDFACCSGHIIGLCEPDEYKPEWGTPWTKEVLPIIPDAFKKKVIKPKYFNQIKEMWNNNKYDIVINAGDAGREGQLIQRLVYEALNINVPVLRYWADDTTEKTIIKTLNHLISDDNYQGLTDASYLRLYFDWLIGMNFSRAASLSLNRPSIIGRVLTATLALIVNREGEIQSFIPTNYWELTARFSTSNGQNYQGTLLNPHLQTDATSKYAFFDLKEIESLLYQIKQAKTGTIESIITEDKVSKAPTLFNLSDLQKECAKRFGFSPSYTQSIAQKLYENQYISYPRTESKCLTVEQAKEIPYVLNKFKGFYSFAPFVDKILNNPAWVEKAISSKKYVNNSKVSDHPALTPTGIIPTKDVLSNDEKSVFLIITCRFLCIFLPENIVAQTTIMTSLSHNKNKYLFRSIGYSEKQAGWKELINLFSNKNTSTDSQNLPAMVQGETVFHYESKIVSKQTVPPKRYDNASILSAMETAGKQVEDEELEKILMECAGLGTPATRGEILDNLFKYGYADKKGASIIPTEQGTQLIKALAGRMIISPELTAVWEKKLKQVENREITYNDFYRAMVKYVSTETTSLLSLDSIGPYLKKIGICPKCGRDFVSLSKFYACMGYFEKAGNNGKACDFGLPKKFGNKPLTETEAKQLINGEITRPKEYIWKDGNKSTASLVLKNFKITFPNKEELREYVGPCPVCGKRVVKGRTGYYCEQAVKKDNNKPLCFFSVYGQIGETTITPNMIREILSYGETKKDVTVKWKSGKSYPGKLILDNQYRITIKPFEKIKIGECPSCHFGTLWEDKFRYFCDNTPSNGGSCLISIPKKFSGKSISQGEAVKLITKGQITKSFTNKNGESYKAILYTAIDEQKGFIIKRKYQNK